MGGGVYRYPHNNDYFSLVHSYYLFLLAAAFLLFCSFKKLFFRSLYIHVYVNACARFQKLPFHVRGTTCCFMKVAADSVCAIMASYR